MRTGPPRQLKVLEPFTVKAEYDPPEIDRIIKDQLERLNTVPQTVTIWAPWFLMSGVGMLVKKLGEFKGYVYPSSFDYDEKTGECTGTITIQPVK